MKVEPGQATTGSVCSKCRAPITWAYTVNNKFQPLDREPAAEGNLRLLEEFVPTPKGVLQRVVVAKPGATLEFGDDGIRYMPHHATCPMAEEFRKPRAG